MYGRMVVVVVVVQVEVVVTVVGSVVMFWGDGGEKGIVV